MISVVVNSRNEGEKLDKCLQSISGWGDEIVVLDMESTDNTRQIAKKYNAKVYSHKALDYIEPVREFAVSKTSGDWVLVLDPDEKIGDELKNKLKEIMSENSIDAVNIPRLNFIFNGKIKHTNFWPDRQIRFFKKGRVRFSSVIHSYPKVLGKVLDLEAKEELSIQHYPYRNVEEYLQRIKRYSDIESKNRYNLGERFSIFNLFYLPLYDFIRRYIKHMGFLDGWRGLVLSILQAYYYILVEIKIFKLQI